jgi:hypothetical protein
LAAGELTWRDDFVTRSLEKLPLKFKLRDN